jgi:hypothetical protein
VQDDAVQQAPAPQAPFPVHTTEQLVPPHVTVSPQVLAFRQLSMEVPVAVLVTVLPQAPSAAHATLQFVPPQATEL